METMKRASCIHGWLASWLLFLSLQASRHVVVHSQTVVPIQLYGLNYNTRKGADWNPQKCKSMEEIIRDLTLLRRLTSRLRILSLTDCGQGYMVLEAAQALGFQIWLGLWVSEDANVFALEIAALQDMVDSGLLPDYAAQDMILGITVGSEAIYREEVTATELVQFAGQVQYLLATRDDLAAIPVAICDIAPVFNGNLPTLVSPIDAVVINIFPFWEATPIGGSIDRLLQQISPVSNYATNVANKPILIGETGWPSDGFIEGVGIASPENSRQFFVDFFCRMDRERGWSYFYFTGIDNAWRQEQDPLNTIEGNWGIVDANLQLKSHFLDFTFTCPSDNGAVIHSFAEIDWTVPVVTVPPTISPAPISAASCQAHAACQALAGNCCPNDAGAILSCCDAPSTPSNPIVTPVPTRQPTSAAPTKRPTMRPSSAPVATNPITDLPTRIPTSFPTQQPTAAPFLSPPMDSGAPTVSPSISRTTLGPTQNPTTIPMQPTALPTASPTANPAIGQQTDSPTTSPVENSITTNPPTVLPNQSSPDSTSTPSPQAILIEESLAPTTASSSLSPAAETIIPTASSPTQSQFPSSSTLAPSPPPQGLTGSSVSLGNNPSGIGSSTGWANTTGHLVWISLSLLSSWLWMQDFSF